MNSAFHVLVVEDHDALRKQLEFILSRAGFAVTSAENGRRALEFMHERFFPIVIADWMMPEMDGIQLCKSIREKPSPGYVYVLLLTAKSTNAPATTPPSLPNSTGTEGDRGLMSCAMEHRAFQRGHLLIRCRRMIDKGNEKPTTRLRVHGARQG